jgi:hypothetical protein
MTDVVNGSSQGTDIPSSEPSSPVQQSTSSVTNAAPEERSFRQSEVNEIVKRAKNDAVDTYRRINAEQPQYAQQKYGSPAPNQDSQTHGQFDENTYRRIASEEAKRHLEEVKQDALRTSQDESAKRTVQNFFAKTGKGREKYQDFDQVTGDVDLGRFPNVVQLLGEFVENSDDVFYELAKDRTKMAMLEQLTNMSPNDAIVQVKRMSKSIQDNQAALKIRYPNEPLSQLRPSNTGTETTALSVSDYRKKYKV